MATWETIDWYETPRWYDAIFDEGTVEEADFLEAVHARYGTGRRSPAPRALEPACGSGRLLVELADRGWRVHGFDREPAMVTYSRERLADAGLAGSVTRADMANFAVRGRFDLAHCLVSTFKYLLDAASARRHLELVAEALRPGGVYALGLHLTDYDVEKRSRERWRATRDGADVTCSIETWPAERRRRRERIRSRLVVRADGRERRSETNWWFRTYDAAQVRRLVRSVPALEHVSTHDFLYDPDEELELSDAQVDTLLILRRR